MRLSGKSRNRSRKITQNGSVLIVARSLLFINIVWTLISIHTLCVSRLAPEHLASFPIMAQVPPPFPFSTFRRGNFAPQFLVLIPAPRAAQPGHIAEYYSAKADSALLYLTVICRLAGRGGSAREVHPSLTDNRPPRGRIARASLLYACLAGRGISGNERNLASLHAATCRRTVIVLAGTVIATLFNAHALFSISAHGHYS